MSRATTLKGLWGNLRFIVTWKTWAVLVVFGAGVGGQRCPMLRGGRRVRRRLAVIELCSP